MNTWEWILVTVLILIAVSVVVIGISLWILEKRKDYDSIRKSLPTVSAPQ